jgi:hypothetical protein
MPFLSLRARAPRRWAEEDKEGHAFRSAVFFFRFD